MAIGVLLIALVVALRVGPSVQDPISSSPSPTAGASAAAAAATPSVSPSASPSPSPNAVAAPLPTVAPGTLQIRTRPLVGQEGDWAFFVQTGFGSAQERTDHLIAVRLSDSTSQRPVETTCVTTRCSPALTTRLLDEQFSPDGRRLGLSVAELAAAGERATLVIVELATGEVRLLTGDRRYSDLAPRWSRDGTRIAFVRNEIGVGDAGIFIIESSGGGLRQVLRGPQPPSNTLLYGWTADSRGLGFSQGFEDADYRLLDLPSGRISEVKGWTSGIGTEDWRTGHPAFVGVFGGSKGGDHTVEVASNPGAPQRVLATQKGPNAFYIEPRWQPGGDQIAVVNTTYQQEPPQSRLLVIDGAGGAAPRTVASHSGQIRARWTPDGTQVVFMEVSGITAAIGLVRSDGTGDRLIFSTGGAPEARLTYTDLAVVRIR